MNFTPNIQRAKDFGREAHDSIKQVRKYNFDPYWTHTERVAEEVSAHGGSEDQICASFLHDYREDVVPELFRQGRLEELAAFEARYEEFSPLTRQYVDELTDVYTKERCPDENRKQRHDKENIRLAKISPEAMTIKLADLIDNTTSIVHEDPNFARIYLKEKKVLMPLLKQGNTNLFTKAMQSLKHGLDVIFGNET